MRFVKKMLAMGLAMLPGMAVAAPVTLALNAGNVLAQTHTRAMMIPSTGTFRQLSGTLHYDPATGACAVDVTFVVNSLALPNAMIRTKTMSPAFLDPAQYPTEHYVATCHGGMSGGTLSGALTLRGQTHSFTMTVRYMRVGGTLTAIHMMGAFNRRDWGIDALPLVVGQTIRVTDDISLNGALPGP